MAENFLLKPVITQVDKDLVNSRVRIKITVSAKSSSYYGPSPASSAIILKGPNGYHKFWGFPEANKWKASWGKPNATYLKNEGYYTFSKYGRLQGFLANRSYDWYEWVQFPPWDGIKNERTLSVKAAQIYTGSHKNFKTIESDPTTITLSKIPEVKAFFAFNISVDDKDQQAQRQIHVIVKHKNYLDPSNENYYTTYLINNFTKERLVDKNATTDAHGLTTNTFNINVTEDMYQQEISFEAQLIGKNKTVYYSETKPTKVIAPDGVGLWFRGATSADINKITNVDFKNNSYREVKEVWVYIDGKWRKTKK